MPARQRGCRRALIFPGEEDFGICPVEAMASGRPVVAYAKGGALETVVENVTGTFFHQQKLDDLIGAIEHVDTIAFDQKSIVTQARRFTVERFQRQIRGVIARAFMERRDAAIGSHDSEAVIADLAHVGSAVSVRALADKRATHGG